MSSFRTSEQIRFGTFEKSSNNCKEKGFNYDAFYWHLHREQREAVDDCGSDCYEVLPVAVTDHTSEFIRVEINGVNICGSTDDLRRLLGI